MVGSRKLTLLDRIRRAVRAFRGEYVGFVVEGSDPRGSLMIIYECDGEKCGDECPNDICNATTDIHHAVNFEPVECLGGVVCYIEKTLSEDSSDEELRSEG